MSLASRFAAGETICHGLVGHAGCLTVEVMAAQGFDAVTLDMQHGGHNEDSVLRCLPSGAAAPENPPLCAFPSVGSTWPAGRSISAPRR